MRAIKGSAWRLSFVAAVALMLLGQMRSELLDPSAQAEQFAHERQSEHSADESRAKQPAGQSRPRPGGGCGATCPLVPAAEDARQVARIIASDQPYTIIVETTTRDGVPIHRARGNLVWGHRHHIGGRDLRDLGFDRPDYEVNSALLSPDKIWTSL